MDKFISLWQAIVDRLEGLGQWLAPLALRIVLFWEFFEAGREKFTGSNWFMDIQGQFPFPFNVVPSGISWTISTWFELIGSIAILLGLATRFFAFGMSVLTIVAIAAVHWPSDFMGVAELLMGYAITDKGHGNYKLPLIFLIMLLPLVAVAASSASMPCSPTCSRRRPRRSRTPTDTPGDSLPWPWACRRPCCCRRWVLPSPVPACC